MQYEDNRIAGEEWPALKPKTPFGTMPILEVDGKTIGGSGPIARYVAEKYGLAGANDLENVELAGIFDMIKDMNTTVYNTVRIKDDAAKAEAKKELLEKTLPMYLGILQARITANGCPEGWIFGSKITYVDMCVALAVEVVKYVDESALKDYPAISKLKAAVEAQPKIAKWIEERPKTQF